MLCFIAGKRVEIAHRFDEIARLCEHYRISGGEQADLRISLTEEEFLREKSGAKGFSDGAVECAAICRKLAYEFTKYDLFLVHGVALECEGRGYLFLGRSGSGKTTHAKLWEKYFNAEILCGDKPFLSEGDGKIYVHSSPWNGKEGYGKRGKAELSALCLIEQNREIAIDPLSLSERADCLLAQLFLPKEAIALQKTLCFADRLTSLPFYRLRCDVSREAAELSFLALTKKKV